MTSEKCTHCADSSQCPFIIRARLVRSLRQIASLMTLEGNGNLAERQKQYDQSLTEIRDLAETSGCVRSSEI